MTSQPKLSIEFTWDHAAGHFVARLPNGASFCVERRHVSGKLENALNLFRGACVKLSEGQKPKATADWLPYTYDEAQIQVVGVVKPIPLTLEDLGDL